MLRVFLGFLLLTLPCSGKAQTLALADGTPPSLSAEGTSRPETSQEYDNQSFQLAVSYGAGKLSLDINGTRSLPKPANTTSYEDGLAVTGTYSGGQVKQLRSVASAIMPWRGRSVVIGLGLEDLDIGGSGAELSKNGGTEGTFHMNSLIMEAGILKNFSRWGQAMFSLSYDHALGGKLRSRYVLKGSRTDADRSYMPLSDDISGGGRLSISGSYQFHLLPGLSFGLYTAAQYGVLRFTERSVASYIYGYTTGLSFSLRI